MKIIPAVDILDGRCAQLVGGKLGTQEYYGSPMDVARNWVTAGADTLHLVDLDAALAKGENTKQIIEIKRELGVKIQAGGGIRSKKKIEEYLNNGVDRVILGTLALDDLKNNCELLSSLERDFGRERIIVALDSKSGRVVTHGWTKSTDFSAAELAVGFSPYAWGFLYTDVDVEGKMSGINTEGVKHFVESSELPVVVSGGISSREDIKTIDELGAWGVVLGKALYEGKLSFEELVK